MGVNASNIDMDSAVEHVAGWIDRGESRYACVMDMHSLMCARKFKSHMSALNDADMVTPDGMPIVWAARLRGVKNMSRVSGPDLLPAICERSVKEGWRHYFHGGAAGVPTTLAERLCQRYPGLNVVGAEAPPYRLTVDYADPDEVDLINAAKPDIVWIALGCPKQEQWMVHYVGKIENAVLIGIGAAFDFHSGRMRRAPLWMQRYGLEWFHRLISEPTRLWRRYLILAPKFLVLTVVEILRERLRRISR